LIFDVSPFVGILSVEWISRKGVCHGPAIYGAL
jgi:hypothetical protein